MIREQRVSGIEGGRKSALSTASLQLRAVLPGLFLSGAGVPVSRWPRTTARQASTGFPGSQFVGRGFTIPGKGQCKPFTGFFTAVKNAPAAGTGCTSTDGSNFSLTILSSWPGSGGVVFMDSISMSLPAQSGEVSGEDNETQNISTPPANILSIPVTGKACTKVVVPASDPATASPPVR